MVRRKLSLIIPLFVVLIIGAWLRFQGLDWDQGHHLHPDERYISMVLTQLSPPKSLSEYLDPSRSSLSPYVKDFGAYIYGQLPLTVVSYLSSWLGMEGYGQAYLLGRALSAILDTFSILLVFVLGKKLWNEKVGLLGAAFYTFTPLAIQYAHFMVMESWLTFSWLLTILISVSFWKKWITTTRSANSYLQSLSSILGKVTKVAVVGVVLGAALAIKASSIMLVPLIIILVTLISLKDCPWPTPRTVLFRYFPVTFLRILFLLLLATLVFRLFQPTIFASAGWFDWSLRPDFWRSFKAQADAIAGKGMWPPQWQWVDTLRWWFPFKNLVLWGVGPVIGILATFGVIKGIGGIREIGREKGRMRLVLALWVLGAFVWQGSRFVKTMRYFVPFLPLYALFAAVALERIILTRMILQRMILKKIILGASLVVSGLWAVMFTNIYRTETTRVQASKWIYENIPAGASIALEEWDDPLPLGLPGESISQYHTFMISVYAPDNEGKERLIDKWVDKADWIVLSSYRAKGGIGQLSDKFPLMNRFYDDLENGRLGFVKAVEITSYPSLVISHWSLVIQDSSAEESWWVYDHPKVEIYRKV